MSLFLFSDLFGIKLFIVATDDSLHFFFAFFFILCISVVSVVIAPL